MDLKFSACCSYYINPHDDNELSFTMYGHSHATYNKPVEWKIVFFLIFLNENHNS